MWENATFSEEPLTSFSCPIRKSNSGVSQLNGTHSFRSQKVKATVLMHVWQSAEGPAGLRTPDCRVARHDQPE